MKYSQQIGVAAALLLVASCFMPWIEIPGFNKTLSGVNGVVNSNITFGTQIKAHAFFCTIAIALFLTNKIWAKRWNIFVCFLSLTWAIKNFILFRLCRPECPVTKQGLYILIFSASIVMLMALLPKVKLPTNQE